MSYLAEQYQLIPNTQMGGRPGKSTETALELLTKQIHTVWGLENDKIALLLSIDVAGAFDTVSHQYLLHNLCKRRILIWIIYWVESFLINCNTTLALNCKTTGFFPAIIKIPQGSPISPMLYLFYNANLFKICKRPGTATSALGFIDNVNILAYNTSTEENLKILERLHNQCQRWACRHGSTFAPKKYKLIHLA